MKETNKKKAPTNCQTRRSVKSEKRENKLQDKNGGKVLKAKVSDVNVSSIKPDSSASVSDSNTGTDSEVYENIDIHYMDDAYISEERRVADQESKEKAVDDHSADLENEHREGIKEESDLDPCNDSISSQGDGLSADDVKIEKASVVLRSPAENDVVQGKSQTLRMKSDRRANNLQIKSLKGTAKQTRKLDGGWPLKGTTKKSSDNSKNVKVHPKPLSESSEGVDDIAIEEVKEKDVLEEALNGTLSVVSDDEIIHNEKNGVDENQEASDRKIEEMEIKIGKLEEELREVAALEIALYSVVPEHGSSAHKLHTPVRRLSRLYLLACKYWSPDKRASVARNTVSGLVLVGRSCGNDVPRLTFWLSNIVVLREIISQAVGSSLQTNGGATRSELKSSSDVQKSDSGGKQGSKQGFMPSIDEWQETGTFTAALEKLESWIFSRVIESIWWQALTPNMQSPTEDSATNKALGSLLGPSLGDQHQGSFSINLWKNAFQDASKRLCPVRATGHECGCLPVLARKVMEQCVGRLDVAMFNAILRESAHEMPTDPVSDPIVDSKVLPIPAGDLSFGSGAQLKNSVGNWSRCLVELFAADSDDSAKEDQNSGEADDKWGRDEPEYFHLLNELGDLLMLPKDMVVDRAIRMEVCPSIGLSLVKRVLCNFSPDELCPNPVPGAILEALNAECIIERRLSGESASNSFPRSAAPVTYTPPSSANVAEKVAEIGRSRELSRNASTIQKKGYTSDEELDGLDSPLTSIVEKPASSTTNISKRRGKEKDKNEAGRVPGNARYDLLREVWLTT